MLETLFSTGSFMPHGHCFFWTPGILWLHVVSDGLIAAAYFSIPLALVYYHHIRREQGAGWIYLMFAAFILACGVSHLFAIWTMWTPMYWLEGLVKAVTAGVSVLTAIALWPLVPRLAALPSRQQLINEIEERTKAHRELSLLKANLEDEVRRRTSELTARENRYRTVLSTITSLVWVTDSRGLTTEPSSLWQTFTGQSPEESLGDGWSAMLHPDDRVIALNALKRAVADRTSFERSVRVHHAESDEYRSCLMRGVPLLNEQGALTEMVITVTDLHAVLRAEGQFRRVIEASPSGIVMTSAEGKIQLVNAEAERIFGYSREELMDKPIELLLPDEYRSRHPRLRGSYLDAPTMRKMGAGRDLSGRRKDGSQVPVEIGLAPIETAGGRGVLSTIVDITERKEAENKQMVLAAELQRSNDELERFAYAASHDLKAPLRAIDNLSKWVIEDAADDLSEQARKDLTLLRERVLRMNTLLDGLLQFSRAARNRSPETSLVDTAQLLQRVIALYEPQDAGRVKITSDMPVFTTAPAPLELVFRNLIGNALKHTPRDSGDVSVSWSRSGALHRFCVADSGPGIDPRFHQQIFEIFTTLRSRDSQEGGGIGLALVKKTVESLGGEVWVDSEPGRGAAFYFTWPERIDAPRLEPHQEHHEYS